MKPTAAAVITKKRMASRLRTLVVRLIAPRSSIDPLFVLVAEAIADAANGEEVLGRARVTLDLLAQVADVDVDRARVPVGGVAPDLLQEHLPRLDSPG